MSMCVPECYVHMGSDIRGQRMSSDPVELELEPSVIPPYIGDGLQIQVL